MFMKRFTALTAVSCLAASIIFAGVHHDGRGDRRHDPRFEEPEFNSLFITSEERRVLTGDSLQLTAVYVDSAGTRHDTTAVWTCVPDSVAMISEDGLLTGLSRGECLVSAVLDTLCAELLICVCDEFTDPEDRQFERLAVLPRESRFGIGDTVQFTAYTLSDTGLTALDSSADLTWELRGMPVGTLSSTGELITNAAGFGLVLVNWGDIQGSAFFLTDDPELDTDGHQTVIITRDSPNPMGYSVMREFSEGELWILGGLPFPMNSLNDAAVYFPYGSLKEDIRIHIALPRFFHVRGDSVDHHRRDVLAGIEFRVMTDDTTVAEPYYFEKPLIAGINYNPRMLDRLDMSAEDLGLYFAYLLGDSVMLEDPGIAWTTVDTCRRRVYSTVAHFSDLVVAAPNAQTATGIETSGPAVAERFKLHQNHPNPFNPVTKIGFDMVEMGDVTMTIVDIQGREIRRWTLSTLATGYHEIEWNGVDSEGLAVTSGIYLYTLSSGDLKSSGKMLLVK